MKKFKKNLKKIIIISFLWLFIITIYGIIAVEAQRDVTFEPSVNIPGYSEKISFEDGTTANIARYIIAIYNYGISIGAILATIVLMAAGLVWLTSGGSQDKIGQAKNMISGSIVGLVLLFSSYMILNMVNPELVNFRVQKIENIEKLVSGCCQLDTHGIMTNNRWCENNSGEFSTEKVLDSLSKQCVTAVCCRMHFSDTARNNIRGSGGVLLSDELCQSYGNVYDNISTYSVDDLDQCSSPLCDASMSWGSKCNYTNNANYVTGNPCWCFDGEIEIGKAQRLFDKCGTKEGAECLTSTESLLFPCPDGKSWSKWGRSCEDYACCY